MPLNLFLQIATLCLSIILLTKGADWLVDSASNIARGLRISESTIGLTFVALGTSAPEFSVSIQALLVGNSDIAIANIVGSNIANIGLILGLGAILLPISDNSIWKESLFLTVISLLLYLAIAGFSLPTKQIITTSKYQGFFFLCLFFKYWGYIWKTSIEERKVITDVSEKMKLKDFFFFFIGLSLLILGGKWLVGSASSIAKFMGMSDWLIGVTIVSLGTSAPEMVTTFIGLWKKKAGLVLGNLIGSDIFNILLVLGTILSSTEIAISYIIQRNIGLLLIMNCLLLFFLLTGKKVS